MRDKLAHKLEFAIADQGDTREAAAAAILRFMIGRGLWPLGTFVKVTKKFKVKTRFPSVP